MTSRDDFFNGYNRTTYQPLKDFLFEFGGNCCKNIFWFHCVYSIHNKPMNPKKQDLTFRSIIERAGTQDSVHTVIALPALTLSINNEN